MGVTEGGPRARRDRSSGYGSLTYGLQAVLADLEACETLRGVVIDFGETRADMPTSGQRLLMFPDRDKQPSEGPDDQDFPLPTFQLASVGSTVHVPGDFGEADPRGAVSYAPRYPGRNVRVAQAAAAIPEPLRLVCVDVEQDEASLLVLLGLDQDMEVRATNQDVVAAVAASALGPRLRASALGGLGPAGESPLARMQVYAVRWQGCAFELYADDWPELDRLLCRLWATLRGYYGPTFLDGAVSPLEEFHVQANVGYEFLCYFRVPIYEETPAVRLRRVSPTVTPRERVYARTPGGTASALLRAGADRLSRWWRDRSSGPR